MALQHEQMSDYDLKNSISTNRLVGIWRMMSGYHGRYLGAAFCQGIAALSKMATYLLLRYFVDHYFSDTVQAVSLPILAAGFIGLALLEGGFTFLTGRFAAQTAEGIARRLREYLFDHIQHLTFHYHSQAETGDLIQRATSDIDAVRRFFADQAIGVGRIILLFLVNFIALTTLNARLAWISIVVVPVVVVVSVYFFRRITRAYEAYQEQEAVLSTTLQENLAGVRVVKAFARQEYEKSKFEKDNWEKLLRGKRLLSLQSFFWPLMDVICGAQLLTGYLIGALMAIRGEISLGTYLAYAGMVIWIIYPMRNLGRLVVQMSTGLVSYGRIMEIIREDREPLDAGDYLPTQDMQGAIQFERVGFEYEPGSVVLEDITFDCQPGQVVALLGSTGSGKTTLVNLLPRFYEYTQGSIRLDGVELRRYPRRYLRRQIGIVEQ
ncbi:MAG: ABC transporter transmembrane domain-containing protein, partial [Anaerolineaceae bacterium]|nr:ABC transporter transmembrane domain-containing protein [Anaerolineaceae bacterium]